MKPAEAVALMNGVQEALDLVAAGYLVRIEAAAKEVLQASPKLDRFEMIMGTVVFRAAEGYVIYGLKGAAAQVLRVGEDYTEHFGSPGIVLRREGA